MSQVSIRAALEAALDGMAPAVATAWENKPFKPPTDLTLPYQQVFLRFADPENVEAGGGYNEVGYMQVKLLYQPNPGSGDAAARAAAIRALFKKKASFSSGGVTATVTKTPSVSGGAIDDGRWAVDVKIPFMAQIYT